MIKHLISAVAALGLTAGTFVIPVAATPAMAQSGSISCEARSPYATGLGVSYDGNAACQRALYECSIRTPYGATCYITRWWYN